MEKQKVDFDNFTDSYNTLLQESTSFFSASEVYFAKYKVDILRSQVPIRTNRLLEYGCGIGRNIPFLRSAFPFATIIGSDISVASLEIAREQNPGIEFIVEQPDEYLDDLYDVIFIAGVFHHIQVSERPYVMHKLFRRLSPGGKIVIFEHNPFNPITRKIVNKCPYDADAKLLRPHELKTLLADVGFTEFSRAYCLFVPPSLSLLLKIERKLGWLPLGGQYYVKATRPL